MAIIGIDDTDSRQYGMCTTFVGHQICKRIQERGGEVHRVLLIRLNPAAKHKTRGNAAVAVHTDMDVNEAHEIACNEVFPKAEVQDDETNPAVVSAPESSVSDSVAQFTRSAITELLSIAEAESIIESNEFLTSWEGNGRGRIGSLAAIGAWNALDSWTYEHIFYRREENWGTARDVDKQSVFEAADAGYPGAWDTVDRVENEVVCVPHTPCPILYGIRGDDPETVRKVGTEINSEAIVNSQLFITNQGTDVHLQEAVIANCTNNSAYKIHCKLNTKPETREGGHVYFTVKDETGKMNVIAFEPTKHFREKVRKLVPGDSLIICGEVSDGTLKLEKFAVASLQTEEVTNPTCPDCDRKMSSAGKNQGYRCRDCNTHQQEKATVQIKRELEKGWYEVPPCARRHISMPLIRTERIDRLTTHPFK